VYLIRNEKYAALTYFVLLHFRLFTSYLSVTVTGRLSTPDEQIGVVYAFPACDLILHTLIYVHTYINNHSLLCVYVTCDSAFWYG